MSGLIRNAVDDLANEHGDDIVRAALRFLPRIISLIKRGKQSRIVAALDAAHTSVDEMVERRKRADEVTVPRRINDTGAADD
jgi:diketogulonate reductase-like aldo/keto reductase